MRTIYQLLISFLLQLFVNAVVAQNITTTLGSFNSSSCAVGDTITLPVNVSMASGISTSAISMAIDYDTTKLRCISAVTNINSNISAGFLSNCGLFNSLNPNPPFTASSRRQFRAAWFNLSPVAFNGLMFNLRFVVVATGNTTIKWDLATPGNCEYADELAEVIPNCSFLDGSVTCGTAIPVNCDITLSSATGTTSQSVCQGSSITNITYSTVSATGATVTGLPAGVTGVWTNNTVTISGTPTAAGTFNYTVTLSGCTGGTGTASGTITVTSQASAGTLSGTQGICVGGTTTFTSTVSGGSWSSSATGIATVNASTGVVNGVTAGTAIITYTRNGTGGCANATATRTVTVNAGSSITLSSAAVTSSQVLTLGTSITNIIYSTVGATGATFSGLPDGVNGLWSGNTITISGTPLTAGAYSYVVTLTGGTCNGGTNTAFGTITVNPTSPNITTTIGTVSGCIGDTVTIPVTINMASGISTSALSLAIDYDTTKLQCISTVTGLNSAISSGFLANCGIFTNLSPNPSYMAPTRRQFRAAWFNLTPVSINGLIFNLRFRVLATGNSDIKWDIATPGNVEFADEFADVIPFTFWSNGAVLMSNGCFGPPQSSFCLPSITTDGATAVGFDSVVIGGNISSDGGSSIVLRGVCYSTSPNPNMGNSRTEDGSGIGSFITVLRGLISSTTYYARSYAKNSNGVVAYGNEVSFTTGSVAPSFVCGSSTVSDVDNNTYNTVQIGTQCWTQSNLKTSKFRNGDNIPTGLSNSSWQNTTSGAYAIYNNDLVNDGLYGKLYNHYAVTDSRGLCPTGWHVPSDGEWTTLENHLGGSSVAGGALKSTAMHPTPGGWNPPNTGATNSSGFTALPGGLRNSVGGFFDLAGVGVWWSSSVLSGSNAWDRLLYSYYSSIYRLYNLRSSGFSVRCLKD